MNKKENKDFWSNYQKGAKPEVKFKKLIQELIKDESERKSTGTN